MFGKAYREWYEMAVKLIKNKDLHKQVYDIFMKMCVLAGKNFSIYKNGEYIAVEDMKDIISLPFKEIYVSNNCYLDIFTELCKKILSKQVFDCFKLNGFYRLPLHPVSFYSAVLCFFEVILFENYWEFTGKKGIRLTQLSSKNKEIIVELSRKAMHNFAFEYPCNDFFKNWQNKSAKYFLSGMHRKEINWNE